ncbi:hypothetical protein PIB30_062022 [Stylosanthes scabra]|uniref:Uncharacterized protein n=1 Tax=Stylosanthes scabra TaxID=79078 RepID=A0ABU6UKG0_9FABA|nr:hypothetical protein [Stylosanthes scabra]
MSSRFKYFKPPRFGRRKYQWRPVLKENQQVNQTMDHSKHQEYMRRVVQQEQETSKKNNQEQGGGTNNNSSVERRTTVGGGGGAAAVKANAAEITNSRLTSFLEKDESFLTPWNWDPNNDASGSLNQQGRKNYHQFHPGTFFFREYPEYFGSRRHYQAPHQPDSNKPSQ